MREFEINIIFTLDGSNKELEQLLTINADSYHEATRIAWNEFYDYMRNRPRFHVKSIHINDKDV